MPKTLPLAVLLEHIGDIPDDLTIYVEDLRELTSMAGAVVQQARPITSCPPGMRYLLEVSLAREAIKVWSDWREGRIPSSDDKVEAVIYFAERDAYLPP
jgi:hypothetical protein